MLIDLSYCGLHVNIIAVYVLNFLLGVIVIFEQVIANSGNNAPTPAQTLPQTAFTPSKPNQAQSQQQQQQPVQQQQQLLICETSKELRNYSELFVEPVGVNAQGIPLALGEEWGANADEEEEGANAYVYHYFYFYF